MVLKTLKRDKLVVRNKNRFERTVILFTNIPVFFQRQDYTYSRASQCRYEIAPGVLAMPNMSRRSIHGDGSGNNSQISHQSLNQTSRRTTESGFSEVTDAGSLLHLVSISNFKSLLYFLLFGKTVIEYNWPLEFFIDRGRF